MSLGNQMFKGFVWSAIERISVQAISLGLTIILGRLLTPTEYGAIGLLIVFISFSQVFIDSGFSKALIQKQNRTEDDISTVFIFNILIAVVCYTILWFAAPFISSFYEIEKLTDLLRVLALSLVFNSLVSIPVTLYTIKMDFKSIAKVNLIATVVSGSVAVYMAFVGYGVWALVTQTLLRSILTTLILWLQIKWRPNGVFSKNSLKELFSFGSKLLASSLLGNVVSNFYALFVANISPRDLGIYTQGAKFSDTFFSIISSISDSVLLPGLSTIQDQMSLLVEQTRKIIKMATLLVTPIFIGLAIIAEPLIRVLLTEKWILAVSIMQILCIARLITIISGVNVNLLYVLGRTDLALKQQYSKIAVRAVLLVIALPFGIVYIALAELCSTAIHFFINTYYPGKFMKYGALQQIRDILPILLAGLLMGIFTYFCMYLMPNDILKLVIPIPSSIAFYYFAIRILKVKELDTLTSKIKNLIKK